MPSSVRKLPQITRGDLSLGDSAARVHGDIPSANGEAGALRIADAVRELSGDAEVQRPHQPVPRAAVRPLAPEQYLIKFTASQATHEKLREAQALLRHQVPSGDVAEIFDRALTLLVAELRKARHAATSRPRSRDRASKTGRHVAAAAKRAVWARDGGQCAFVGAAGRCTERGFLQYHHVIPFADGGATDASNLQLRCRAHNRFEAERWSGPGEEDLLREVSPIYGANSVLDRVEHSAGNRSLSALVCIEPLAQPLDESVEVVLVEDLIHYDDDRPQAGSPSRRCGSHRISDAEPAGEPPDPRSHQRC